MCTWTSSNQVVLISLDNDQLSTILIVTITTRDIRSDSDGASIVAIISLPTSRSNVTVLSHTSIRLGNSQTPEEPTKISEFVS